MKTRGPEGEQVVRDEKGKLVKSEMSVDYVGFNEYVQQLLAEAGLIDPEVERLVKEWKRVDEGMAKIERFFGRMRS